MNHNTVWIIIPVKRFSDAKLRLRSVLSAAERQQLARVMFEDVLQAVRSSDSCHSRIIVPTGDNEAGRIARENGAQVLYEPLGSDLNYAVNMAACHVARDAEAGIIVVPSDIPHISQECIQSAVKAITANRSAAIVPATADRGTNLLACRPAQLITPRFGPESFERHCQLALAAGVKPTIITGSREGRDIDRPSDLRHFLELDTKTRTNEFLTIVGIAERLRTACVSPAQPIISSQ